jgi:hypothetical protein
MSIQNRLTKLETLAPAPATATGGLLGYFLGVVEAVYEGADADDQARRVAALGPQPEPATTMESTMLTHLNKAYGGTA